MACPHAQVPTCSRFHVILRFADSLIRFLAYSRRRRHVLAHIIQG